MQREKILITGGVGGSPQHLRADGPLNHSDIMAKLTQLYDEIEHAIGAVAGNGIAGTESDKVKAANKNGFRIVKMRCFGQYTLKTEGDGPAIMGVACNLTHAEVLVQILRDPGNSSADGSMPDGGWIKYFGSIPEKSDGVSASVAGWGGGSIIPNYGFVDIDVNWSVPEGQNLIYFLYNPTGAAFTTGAKFLVQSVIEGVWLRD